MEMRAFGSHPTTIANFTFYYLKTCVCVYGEEQKRRVKDQEEIIKYYDSVHPQGIAEVEIS